MYTNNWIMSFLFILLCLHILDRPSIYCPISMSCIDLYIVNNFKDINITIKVWDSNIDNLYIRIHWVIKVSNMIIKMKVYTAFTN